MALFRTTAETRRPVPGAKHDYSATTTERLALDDREPVLSHRLLYDVVHLPADPGRRHTRWCRWDLLAAAHPGDQGAEPRGALLGAWLTGG